MNFSKEILEAINQLTEMRYGDPTFIGEESVSIKDGIVKMQVESWLYDCVTDIRDKGLTIEDCDEEIFNQWKQEEARKGFSLLEDMFGFDSFVGDFGQHFAFFYK